MQTFVNYLKALGMKEDIDYLAPGGVLSKLGTGGIKSEQLNRLQQITRIAIDKFPNKVLTFLKTLQNEDIQQRILELENDGFNGLQKAPQQGVLGTADDVFATPAADQNLRSEE